MKVKCDYCGKVFDRPDWEHRKNLARGQTKIFCSYACHHKSMMSPICHDDRIVNKLYVDNKSTLNKVVRYWQNQLSNKASADKIESKAYLALSQFPMTDAFNLPADDKKKVFRAYINAACKHAFYDVIKEKKTVPLIEH